MSVDLTTVFGVTLYSTICVGVTSSAPLIALVLVAVDILALTKAEVTSPVAGIANVITEKGLLPIPVFLGDAQYPPPLPITMSFVALVLALGTHLPQGVLYELPLGQVAIQLPASHKQPLFAHAVAFADGAQYTVL
jgi:hypothetical protein